MAAFLGTETVPYREDCLAATPIARIPTLVTEDGQRPTESSVIGEYLNDEFGDYRLCPQSGRERWHILSVVGADNIAMSRGEWRHASKPWHEPGIGNLVYNPPNIVHAMRSAAQPL